MGDRPIPSIAKWTPAGDRIEGHQQPPSYTPPTRDQVAQAVRECEPVVRCRRGENPVGVLLRDTSEKLYKDATTNIDKSRDVRVFPHALLVEVLTETRVFSSLSLNSREARSSGYSGHDCIKRICGDNDSDKLGPFARVFTVLLLCDEPQDIFLFFDNNLGDADFPFEVTRDKKIRPKCSGDETSGLEEKQISLDRLDWPERTYDSFKSYQWTVFLPTFSDESGSISHQDFTADTIMPWHECVLQMSGNTSWTTASTTGGTSAALSGGHGSVRRVIIHDGHYNFRGIPQPSRSPGSQDMIRTFAVKRLNEAGNKAIFNQEVAMLRELGGKTAHTIRLLATFYHDGTYSLLFPWAECDLLAYWGRDLGPAGMSAELILWAINQCQGLVSALAWIHNPGLSGVSLSVRGERFGRHGDIKPENILWFKENGDGPHPLASGQLVFSDFGLSALNHKDSRSGAYNKDVLCTTTYAAPENLLGGHKINRAVDIWALGCVFLEFVTWIVGGTDLIDGLMPVERFKQARLAPHLDTGVDRDVFWMRKETPNPSPGKALEEAAVVKPQVVKWIRDLRKSPRATQFVRDFLQIIEEHMLVIEKGKRELLRSRFDDMKARCRDPSYYTPTSAIYPPAETSLVPQIPRFALTPDVASLRLVS